ncbi:hypothetical protein KP77_07710 [Jeotgalibacillus alimentarius]|uniref:DUF4306 domain-containing protein n=1 Tax=Jeotgalibacillus alimentarius TaxID=135826 RepID=A0A0C2SBB7_9BACL|nr:YjdJ family protein [Jeotgalibacillus alimentarius]KIL51259.1 hypothetical protein KP77_07710 [Jeotgalibacillus alimentarius]
MRWFSIQFGAVFTLFMIAALGSWYEGSGILNDPWEWKYSAPLSTLIHGDITSESQILQLDHFVYAAKFQPLLPLIMVFSGLYLLLLIAYRLFRQRIRLFAGLLVTTAVLLFALSYAVYPSPTAGGHMFFYSGLSAGLLTLSCAALYYRGQKPGQEQQV